MKWLIEDYAVGVDTPTKDDTTPLQLAAWGGHVEVCAWLREKGATDFLTAT